MNTFKDMADLIGRTGKVDVAGPDAEHPCLMSVEIINAKVVWQTPKVEVKPLVGVGTMWKNLGSVRLDDPEIIPPGMITVEQLRQRMPQ